MNIKEEGIHCLQEEAQAILNLIPKLDEQFEKTVELIYQCKGKLVVTGVGKSGHIGSKIAATLASTGTPSFYLNPLDAFHGDLGMIEKKDVVMAISNSGTTDELLRFFPMVKEQQIPIIGMSGNPDSPLAHQSTYHLNISVEREADPLNLVPTNSTTATLAMGDALACALMVRRKFQPLDFARFHPGGELGRRLQQRVEEIMVCENLPIVSPDTPLGETIEVVTNGKLGIAIIIENEKLMGIVTDGDVRRAMLRLKEQFFTTPVSAIMCTTPKTIVKTAHIAEAGELMNNHSIHSLIVMDEQQHVAGVIDSFSCLPGTRYYH